MGVMVCMRNKHSNKKTKTYDVLHLDANKFRGLTKLSLGLMFSLCKCQMREILGAKRKAL